MTIQQLIDMLRPPRMNTGTEQTPPSGTNDLHGWRTAKRDSVSARTVQAFGKRMGNANWEGIPRRPGQ